MDSALETLSEVDPAKERDLGAPQPQLFRIFECHCPLASSARHCLGDIDSVVIGRGARRYERGSRAARQLRIAVPDPWMSSSHARLLRTAGVWALEDAGSRNGTLVNGSPTERAMLTDGDILELGRTFFLFRSEQVRSTADPKDLELNAPCPVSAELASLSLPLAQQIRSLVQVAESTISIVVQGETGTGKERIAQALHRLSRRPGAFVAVNCGALPSTLIETELFGCRRGAFTGACDRPGLVRTADRGTLFLDEIGDLSPAAQGALLRVLQERQVHAVGATHALPVDFRLVSATQEPLDALVAAGRFRADLRARLTGLTVQLPPLRQRREDMGLILATLIRRLAPDRATDVTFEKEAARTLLLHPFPLNIRELEKCLESAIALANRGPIQRPHLSLNALSGGPVLLPEHFPVERLSAPLLRSPSPTSVHQGLATGVREVAGDPERLRILTALAEAGGNQTEAARLLGVSRKTLGVWLDAHRINRPRKGR